MLLTLCRLGQIFSGFDAVVGKVREHVAKRPVQVWQVTIQNPGVFEQRGSHRRGRRESDSVVKVG
jgi:hypothetical protein